MLLRMKNFNIMGVHWKIRFLRGAWTFFRFKGRGELGKKEGGGLIPQCTLRDITEDINSLNSKQREVINVVYTWAEDYVKCNGHNVEHVN